MAKMKDVDGLDIEVHTTAVVKVVLEVKNTGSWGHECTLDQVLRQSIRHAEDAVNKMIDESGKTRDIYIRGKPTATCVSMLK